jgi:predicted component of type VI protein secretion system
VRRETAGAYLKAAGIGVRPSGAWGRRPPAKPANENGVTTGSDAAKPANTVNPNPNPENLSTKGKAKARTAKPANENAVTTGFGAELSDSERKRPIPVPSTSLCEPFREAIELGLSQGGAVAFLAKPFDNSVLLDRVRACLKGTQDDD